jgi:hypothetical protein
MTRTTMMMTMMSSLQSRRKKVKKVVQSSLVVDGLVLDLENARSYSHRQRITKGFHFDYFATN